ncbi:NAD(P)-dependent oxidoreductase [Micrococcales bacterium 31B]|nr:NAD(P)-dependent oxidoreductase [Micrococcales bacterium 31B]
MKILVTGAAGKLGRAVVADLVEHGHTVFAVDQTTPADSPAQGATVLDLTDFGQVMEAFLGIDEHESGFDAVVHLAAIPAPGRTANHATFANNVVATYNVFAAARHAGVRKVVWASSETVLGLPFATLPPYVPVDEEYSVRPESTYSLGKAAEEEMARHFARWEPEASLIGLRFSNVMNVEDYERFDTWQETPEAREWNLWGYIDARDGAQAVRLAAEASDRRGAEVFIIAAADTVMRRETKDLLTGRHAAIPVQGDVSGRTTLLSIERARRELGFDPQHSWLDHHDAQQ